MNTSAHYNPHTSLFFLTDTIMYHNPATTLSSSLALPLPLPLGLDDVHLTPSSMNPPPRNHKPRTALANTWREIQGCGDWQRLIKPLDPLLREEITRYGEFAAACYKAFDFDQHSRRYLNCKYGKKSLFEAVGMGTTGYEITKYIYATPEIPIPIQPSTSVSRWIGYVAVASDSEVNRLGRRDILVAFRGTVTGTEWIANFMSSLSPARFDPNDPQPDVMVESGFLSLYTSDDNTRRFSEGSCREQLLNEVSRIIDKYRDEDLSVTMVGHSMGSSLALLLGYDIAELELNRDARSNREIPLTVFKFAGPRVGNAAFKKRCEELGIKVLRVANVNDPVTKLPGFLMNEHLGSLMGKYEMPWSCSCYTHVGVELALDFFRMRNPAWAHDLEAYIEVLETSTTKIASTERYSTWEHAPRLMRNALNFLGF